MVIVKDTISSDNIGRFKRVYNKAIKEGRYVFDFEGNQFVTDYAKYLIEYLSGLKK